MSRFPPQAFRRAIEDSPALARRLAAIEQAMIRQGKPARSIHAPDQLKNQNTSEVRPCVLCGRFFCGRQDHCYRCRFRIGKYHHSDRAGTRSQSR
jgi:hypothetical protein